MSPGKWKSENVSYVGSFVQNVLIKHFEFFESMILVRWILVGIRIIPEYPKMQLWGWAEHQLDGILHNKMSPVLLSKQWNVCIKVHGHT